MRDDIKNFSEILMKIFNNFEKEYNHSLIKFERKKYPSKSQDIGGESNRKMAGKENLTNNKKESCSLKKKFTLSLKEKFSFISQFKYVCKLFSNYNTITLKKSSESENIPFKFDFNSFKNKIRYSEFKELKEFPWSMIKLKNYNTEKIKFLFNYLIPDESTYNRKILKRKIQHKDKIIDKNGAMTDSKNFINVIYESGVEAVKIENFVKDENLYCYCKKTYSEGDLMISKILLNELFRL